jgi:trimethylamine--corrinoid protein Co-methyltransferase
VLDPGAASILRENGATLDEATETVRIPGGLVKETVGRAPREFTLYGRGKGREARIAPGRTVLGSVGTPVQVLDLDGNLRSATLPDADSSFRLVDALPNLDYASWCVWPTEVNQSAGHICEMLSGFRNTTKPMDGYTWGERQALDTIELASVIAGGEEQLMRRPMLLGFANPVSPLTLSKEPTEGVRVYAKFRQPIVFPPEFQSGATAPATLAGLLAQQNAEVLASVVLAQLVSPGTPVLYGTVSTIMDMRTGNIALGAPEAGIIGAATAQVAHSYGLPCRATGGNTDSMALDFQAGSESNLTLLLPALAGAEFIYDVAGSLESSLTMSYEKLVLDDEVAGAVKRLMRGVEADSEAIALDVIRQVRQTGSYLSKPHTLKHFREEHHAMQLFNRDSRSVWLSRPTRELMKRANARARELLATHTVEPLEHDLERTLQEIADSLSRRHTQSDQFNLYLAESLRVNGVDYATDNFDFLLGLIVNPGGSAGEKAENLRQRMPLIVRDEIRERMRLHVLTSALPLQLIEQLGADNSSFGRPLEQRTHAAADSSLRSRTPIENLHPTSLTTLRPNREVFRPERDVFLCAA